MKLVRERPQTPREGARFMSFGDEVAQAAVVSLDDVEDQPDPSPYSRDPFDVVAALEEASEQPLRSA